MMRAQPDHQPKSSATLARPRQSNGVALPARPHGLGGHAGFALGPDFRGALAGRESLRDTGASALTAQWSRLADSTSAPVLRRKCAQCGTPETPGDRCSGCERKIALQRRLAIGAASDPAEREADRAAEQALQGGAGAAGAARPPILHRRASGGDGGCGDAPASVHQVLARSGRPLEATLRRDMEGRFGQDFSKVRIHDGAEAGQSARDVGALAYTVGSNIAFAAGRYSPASDEGRRLLAHELAHVVQQSGPDGAVRRMQPEAAPSGTRDLVLRRTPAAPTNAAGPVPRDLNRISIDPVADFLASSLTAPRNVNVHLNDATVAHLTWELFDPSDQMMTGSFSTMPGRPNSTNAPFPLQPSHFSGSGFVAGKYVLRCTGLGANHQPVVYADRDFYVLATDLTTGTALPTTYGSLTFTQYAKTDMNPPARPRWSVNVVLQFLPTNAVVCSEIGFLQTAQALDSAGQSLMANSSAQISARQTTLAWAIDRIPSAPTPFYGTERVGTGPVTMPAGKGRFGQGGPQPSAASLIDIPSWNRPASIRFESCAVCRSGANNGQVYGCATWGFTASATGQITLMPRSFRQMPSDQFEEARAAWNTWQAAQPAASRPEAAPALRSP